MASKFNDTIIYALAELYDCVSFFLVLLLAINNICFTS